MTHCNFPVCSRKPNTIKGIQSRDCYVVSKAKGGK